MPEDFVGKRIKCPGCGTRFPVEANDCPPADEGPLGGPADDHDQLETLASLLDLNGSADPNSSEPDPNDQATASFLASLEEEVPLRPQEMPELDLSDEEMSEPKIWEYKVLTQKDKWFSGKFDPAVLETAMNAYAKQGWRVISVTTASIPGFGGNREELLVVLER